MTENTVNNHNEGNDESNVTIVVDNFQFAGWKKLELYDGAKKVDGLAKGPAEFTVKDLKAGYHAFSVLARTPTATCGRPIQCW